MFDNREAVGGSPRHELALDCLAAGIEAAHPDSVVPRHLACRDGHLIVDGDRYDLDAFERVFVLGGGKAAGTVAAAIEDCLGAVIDDGVVVTDSPTATQHIRQIRGAHPLPDEAGLRGARAVRELAAAADEKTLVVAVLTGGGSALLPAPVSDVSLVELREVTASLLEAGAPIEAVNAVRKHLSELKGGRLASVAEPATVVGLVFSDVVGDDLGVVASGPLSPDPTTFADAIAALDRYGVEAPTSVRTYLSRGTRGEVTETPASNTGAFDRVSLQVLASNRTAVEAAAALAEARDVATAILSTATEGEAQVVGRSEANRARQAFETGDTIGPPAVLLSGGETTVTVTGSGEGGPNQEVALAAGIDLADHDLEDVTVASVDTDGIDGNSHAAGAIVDGDAVPDRRAARDALAAHDVTPFLEAHNGLLVTGATGTNVNDLRVFVIGDVPSS